MQAGGTLCLSSQVGCRMGCAFCETGRMGLLRNLTAQEIASQLFVARFILGFQVRNLVFMGMGEPFDNYENIMQAVRVFTDPNGFGLGIHHLTISTSGRVAEIYRLIEEKGPIPHLAVSINAPRDNLRNRLMPVNRAYPLKELYQAMHDFNMRTRLSTTTGWPRLSASLIPTARPIVSGPPPAAMGMISRIGLSGKDCAAPCAESASSSATQAPRSNGMLLLLVFDFNSVSR